VEKTVFQDLNGIDPTLSFSEDLMRMEYWVAKQIGEDLVRTYPGRQWHVECDLHGSVLIIRAPSLSKRSGWCIHIKRDTVADLIPKARKAAGTILEMFACSRSRLEPDPLELEFRKRNVRDDVIAPDAEHKPNGVNPIIHERPGVIRVAT